MRCAATSFVRLVKAHVTTKIMVYYWYYILSVVLPIVVHMTNAVGTEASRNCVISILPLILIYIHTPVNGVASQCQHGSLYL